MKKLTIFILGVAFSHSLAFSQACLPEGITFTTQEQIDNFQSNYPGCTQIEGSVEIGGSLFYPSNISNLNGLSDLTSIGGNLALFCNPNLTSLSGLGNLTSIWGDLSIDSFNAFTNLTGLVILDSIAGSLRINGTGLSSLTGLGNLTFIGGGLEITNNSSLISLTGLDNLTSIGNDLYINNNFSLSTCEAEWMCGYLTNPSGSINISDNANGCKSIIELSIACGGSIPCLPYGNYLFYSQTDIDHFPLAFPECIELEGNVTISGSPLCPSNISNLSGLSVLTTIGGDLNIGYNYNGNYIGNPLLINLTGLENLDSIRGSLLIRYNDTLNSFAALNNLTSIGGTFVINSNNALISLAGLENLNSTGGLGIAGNDALTSLTGLDNLNFIGGDFFIGNNLSISNLTGLENVNSIGKRFLILENSALTSLNGLDALTSVGESFEISKTTGLANLTGLNALNSIGGGFAITDNTSLSDLSGLNALTSIGDFIRIYDNHALISFTGLDSLTSIGEQLQIIGNNALINLTGLDHVDSESVTELRISENYSLSNCSVQSICEYLASPNGTIQIYMNAPGCNSPEEVEEACLTPVKEMETVEGITIIPNPSKDKITVYLPAISGNTRLSIFNISGGIVFERQLTDTETQLDISTLSPGMYFVQLQNEKSVVVTKLMKE